MYSVLLLTFFATVTVTAAPAEAEIVGEWASMPTKLCPVYDLSWVKLLT